VGSEHTEAPTPTADPSPSASTGPTHGLATTGSTFPIWGAVSAGLGAIVIGAAVMAIRRRETV